MSIAAASDLAYCMDELNTEFRRQHPGVELKTTTGASGDQPGRFAQGPEEKLGDAGRSPGLVTLVIVAILPDRKPLVGEGCPTAGNRRVQILSQRGK